jgi:hypothetical protein
LSSLLERSLTAGELRSTMMMSTDDIKALKKKTKETD